MHASDLGSAAGGARSQAPPPGRIRAKLKGLEGEIEVLPAGLDAPQRSVVTVVSVLLVLSGLSTYSLSRGPLWLLPLCLPLWISALSLAATLPRLLTERVGLRLGPGGLTLRRSSALGSREVTVAYAELTTLGPHPLELRARQSPWGWAVALSRLFSDNAYADHHVFLRWPEGAEHFGQQLRPGEVRWLLEILRAAARR